MITVNPARPADVHALAELAEKMDRFYGATDTEPLELRVSQINEAIFGASPSAHVLLAWDQDKLAGFASYSFLWPAAGLTRSLFLKELYVAETARRQGVGKLLMQRLYAIAVERGCSRVEWMTEKENTEAQGFYTDLGAQVNETKLFYRIAGDELRRLGGLDDT